MMSLKGHLASDKRAKMILAYGASHLFSVSRPGAVASTNGIPEHMSLVRIERQDGGLRHSQAWGIPGPESPQGDLFRLGALFVVFSWEHLAVD